MRARRILVGTIALVALAAVLAPFAWPRRGERKRAESEPFRLLFTSETLGEIEPCGCSGDHSGGLPRRGAFVAAQKNGFVLVDVGCMGTGARDFERLRLDAVLRGMAEMGYDAANVGERELWLGRAELARRAREFVPLVSANVMDGGVEPVVQPSVTVERDGLRVAVTGLVASHYAAGPGLVVHEPCEALARLLPDLAHQADRIVLLADLDEPLVRRIATRFPELSAILYRGHGNAHAPEVVNRTAIAAVGGESLFVGELILQQNADGVPTASGTPVMLDEDVWPLDPAVAETSVQWYKQAIHGRTFDLRQPARGWRRLSADPPPGGDRYVGSAACKACHAPSYAAWESSTHAHAMGSLERAGYHYSPECIVCHVVGYGAPDGYVSRDQTPELARVGCEACHGRGGRHVASRGEAKGAIVRSGEPTCLRCHTPKRSTGFLYPDAWRPIAHGEPGE
ncbi:MAG: multiheme c-type cytochrome [bacterium]